MLTKIRDFTDTDVSMVILVDNVEDLDMLADVIVDIGKERLKYEVYKNSDSTYMLEIRMPYNRYIAMMKGLHKHGYNLKPKSKADIFNKLIKD